MNISIIHDDGSENEFDLDLCCESCVAKSYRWSIAQYNSINEIINSGKTITLPNHIDDLPKFVDFVKANF